MDGSLKDFGAEYYVKARECGYVLYVQGGTDVDMLRALAKRMNHPVAALWDERINSFYMQNNYPDQDIEAELDRIEGGFGVTPQQHFNGLRNLLPRLLRNYAKTQYPGNDLFVQQTQQLIEEVLSGLVLEQIFDGTQTDFGAWTQANAEVARVLWQLIPSQR